MKFGVSYWLIVALCIVFYSAIFPFQTFAVKFFMEAHGTSREFGGFLVQHADAVRDDRNSAFRLLGGSHRQARPAHDVGSLLLIPVYLMMAYTQINLYIPMAMMGVAFSLIPAVMWPAVAYIVEQSKLGTAYGLMTMIQNIGLFGLNILVGWANNYCSCRTHPTLPAITSGCGFSPFWACLGSCSRSSSISGKLVRTGTDWRRSRPRTLPSSRHGIYQFLKNATLNLG